MNTLPLIRFLAEQYWHDIGDHAWDDISKTIDYSDAESDNWAEVALGEDPSLILSFARTGTARTEVLVRADGSDWNLSLCRVIVQFLNRFAVRDEA